jgi:tRNA pseudouridine55 synthase
LNGVLVIDKPQGWTSHDVVAWIRRTLKVKKAGHGGTLDPLATGVLPVYLGEGTKLVPFNLEGTKEYRAKMKLGQETDTLDAAGKIVAECRDFSRTRQQIEEVLGRFRGAIRQTPPLFSAVKINGRPLYKWARSGEKPQVASREAMIHELSLIEMELPFLTLDVTCGRGTYVRTLCADIGRTLGCGAHVVELRRTRSGKFTIDQALTPDEVAQLVALQRVEERIISLKDGADLAEAIRVEDRTAEGVRQGRPLKLSDLPEGARDRLNGGSRIGIWHGPGKLLAIAEVSGQPWVGQDQQALRILRVFHG